MTPRRMLAILILAGSVTLALVPLAEAKNPARSSAPRTLTRQPSRAGKAYRCISKTPRVATPARRFQAAPSRPRQAAPIRQWQAPPVRLGRASAVRQCQTPSNNRGSSMQALTGAQTIGAVRQCQTPPNNSAPKLVERAAVQSTDRRDHRFAPFRGEKQCDGSRTARTDNKSWNRFSVSRAERFAAGNDCGRQGFVPGLEAYNGYGVYGGPGAYSYFESTDAAEVFLNQSYYDDGPYGPGYYDRQTWYNWYIASHRTGQLLDMNEDKIDEGMELFRAGRYDRAAVALLGAARADQTDAASRIHAGHALFAVGRYSDAVALLARAFELAPHLAESQYDMRTDYLDPAHFEAHLTSLKTRVADHPDDAAAAALLGYVIYYSDGPAAAFGVLDRARQMDPANEFVGKLWNVARLVGDVPQTEVEAQPNFQEPAFDSSEQQMQPAPATRKSTHRAREIRQVRADGHW